MTQREGNHVTRSHHVTRHVTFPRCSCYPNATLVHLEQSPRFLPLNSIPFLVELVELVELVAVFIIIKDKSVELA